MKIAPSVLAADFTNLESEMKKVQNADYLHLDIMDGHFVPNISFGPDVVAQLKTVSDVTFDVHLMISHPLKYLDVMANAGADIICFHVECGDDPKEVIEKIKELGKLPAMSLKPGTDIKALDPYIDELFMVLIMTVEPGFGGQKFMEDQLSKVRYLKENYPNVLIEADGGIGSGNIALCKEAGVDICVAGTAVFGAENPSEEIKLLQSF